MSWFIINSERDGQLLVLDKFIHRLDKIRDSNLYYKRIDNCGGRAVGTQRRFKQCYNVKNALTFVAT